MTDNSQPSPRTGTAASAAGMAPSGGVRDMHGSAPFAGYAPAPVSGDLSLFRKAETLPRVKHLEAGFAPCHRESLSLLKRSVMDQVGYSSLVDSLNRRNIDEIAALITEVLSADCASYRFSGKSYPAELVRERFRQIDCFTVEYVMDCLSRCTSRIHNIKQYMIATLFNATATRHLYYDASVRHDLPC